MSPYKNENQQILSKLRLIFQVDKKTVLFLFHRQENHVIEEFDFVIIIGGYFCSPKGFLDVTTVREGSSRDATDISYVESRDAVKHSSLTKTALCTDTHPRLENYAQ